MTGFGGFGFPFSRLLNDADRLFTRVQRERVFFSH